MPDAALVRDATIRKIGNFFCLIIIMTYGIIK